MDESGGESWRGEDPPFYHYNIKYTVEYNIIRYEYIYIYIYI